MSKSSLPVLTRHWNLQHLALKGLQRSLADTQTAKRHSIGVSQKVGGGKGEKQYSAKSLNHLNLFPLLGVVIHLHLPRGLQKK